MLNVLIISGKDVEVEIESQLMGMEIEKLRYIDHFDTKDAKMTETTFRSLSKKASKYDLVIFHFVSDLDDLDILAKKIEQMNNMNPYLCILQYPAVEIDFERIIKHICDMLLFRKRIMGKKIFFKTVKGFKIINEDFVYYVERYKRGTKIITEKKVYYTKTSLEKFLEDNKLDFCRCGYSFAVNNRYISETNNTTIILHNGKCVPISRDYRKNVKKIFE